ncbi:hypothetical protein [Prevotella corporis]|uniref:hypothetical protein n=1 Tax=Prevotella corporis TaxID=28128 RepID=UPI0012DD72A7|nr:hypothetical protein [Prevotella corporis]
MRSIYRKWQIALLQKLLSKLLNGGSSLPASVPSPTATVFSSKTSATLTNGIPILTKNICHPYQWQPYPPQRQPTAEIRKTDGPRSR